MICKNCGNEFIPSKNDERIKFCSDKCRCEYRVKNGYMKTYYKSNIEKWKETNASESHKKKKNELRRKKYAEDAEYRERTKQKSREYTRNNPESKLRQHLSERGITLEEYNALLKKQNYKCAICGKIADACSRNGKYKHRSLFVDHDHATGNIRGLLCDNCNFILGHAKDDIHILENAIEYLKRGVQT